MGNGAHKVAFSCALREQHKQGWGAGGTKELVPHWKKGGSAGIK